MAQIALVTGAAGFVGQHLVRTLSANNSNISIVAWKRPERLSKSTTTWLSMANQPQVEWQQVDLLDTNKVRSAIEEIKPNDIYHCAGIASANSSWNNTLTLLEGNIRATHNLFHSLKSVTGSVRVLIPGSALVYRASNRILNEDDPLAPTSPYGLSKLAQEMLAQRYLENRIAVIITRSFTHIGPGQNTSYAASSFAHQIAKIESGLQEPVIRVGNLDAQRDITDVRDTVRAYTSLMEDGLPGHPYNVCSGKAQRIGDVLDTLLTQSTVPVRVQTDSSRVRQNDNSVLVGDNSRLTDATGWQPRITLQQTLSDLLDYWRHAVV